MYFSIAGLTGEARDEALRDLGIGINKRSLIYYFIVYNKCFS